MGMAFTGPGRHATWFVWMDGGFRIIGKLSYVSMVDVLAVYNTCLMAGCGGGAKRTCTKSMAKHGLA